MGIDDEVVEEVVEREGIEEGFESEEERPLARDIGAPTHPRTSAPPLPSTTPQRGRKKDEPTSSNRTRSLRSTKRFLPLFLRRL